MNDRQMNSQSTRNNTACSKCPCMVSTLEKAGVETTNYLSLRINKADLPDNAELIVQLRDKKTGQLISMNLNDEENSLLGKNSRFYGKVMADGHIFNPMIHRRFIAKQFRELVRRYGVCNLYEAVQKTYNWKYAIDMVRKEVHKLAMLERHDKQAFAERKQFFTLDTVNRIMADYVNQVQCNIDKALKSEGVQCRYVYTCAGPIERQNIRPVKHRFDMLLINVSNCRTYAELDVVLDNFDFCELSRRALLPESFITPFLESGAFYTMKHAIMFEGKNLYGRNQQDSLKQLQQTAKNGIPHACMNLYRSAGF